jgi:hypothetical protein
MSVKNFRFVSPGVFVNEVDNSQLPASPAGIGPVVIGRAEKGPALRPTQVNSFSEFVQVFGTPSAGNAAGDVWRQGSWNETAPTYGVYAAQAYLRNSSPLTYIRLLGSQAPASDIEVGTGEAGWDGGTNGKAWGLVVFEPESAPASSLGTLEGTLAAIFYTTDSSTTLQLSGAIATQIPSIPGTADWSAGVAVTGSGVVVCDSGTPYEFKMLLHNAGGDVGAGTLTTSFNFDIDSSRYIRKIFNTTPARTNSALVESESNYFLGETFDRMLRANVPATAGSTYAALVEITDTTTDGDSYRAPVQSAETPYIIGCDLSERGASSNDFTPLNSPALFKVVALDQPGDWSNRNLKISIEDIKISTNETDPYGTFSLVVRSLSDSDNVVRIVESFTGLDLNPDSLNYIARKVGDRYATWDSTERRYVEYGDYPNVSKYIRVSVNEEIVGDNASLLPFGFRGILKYEDESSIIDSGVDGAKRTANGNWVSGSAQSLYSRPPAASSSAGWGQWQGVFAHYTTGSVFIVSGSQLTASVFYPAPEFRVSASAGNLSNRTDAYFGLQTTRTAGGTVFDHSNIDTLRPRGAIVADMFSGPTAGSTERSMYFTLDDISGSKGVWISGSHAAGTSLTNVSGAVSGVLDSGYDRFTVPLYGGFDGVNIRELDPFANRNLTGTPTDANNYTFNSIRQSIDAISDPEVVEMNLAAIPGLKQSGLTTNLINVCEDRADALAIVDLEGGYSPRAEGKTASRNNTLSDINSTIASLRDRALNTSYGCCFYPWLRARDTINGSSVWVPPSVAALGTFSSSQKKTQVWFAPAGFNRGGLTEGAAGIPIVDVAHKLTRKNRDDLYTANINPIAKFPAEGIVIFGQKTLQVTPSALDRINVRRLMIFVKKRVSQAAATLLFDPNVQTTWNRFVSSVTPILSDIKTNFGLSDFKLVLDETTTTPELVDRNIMYARIFLKPTRAIEYIAIDFNITRTGASFDD